MKYWTFLFCKTIALWPNSLTIGGNENATFGLRHSKTPRSLSDFQESLAPSVLNGSRYHFSVSAERDASNGSIKRGFSLKISDPAPKALRRLLHGNRR